MVASVAAGLPSWQLWPRTMQEIGPARYLNDVGVLIVGINGHQRQ